MLDFKTQLNNVKLDIAFIKNNQKIVKHEKLHKYLNEMALVGKKRVERVSPKNIGVRPKPNQKPMSQSIKIGKIRIEKKQIANIEYKVAAIYVFFSKSRSYYKYAIAGRRIQKGKQIIYSYKWPLAVKYPFVDTWETSKLQFKAGLDNILIEILNEISKKKYHS